MTIILKVAVTAIERGNHHVTKVNLATPANDVFVEITSSVPLNGVEVGQPYMLAINPCHGGDQAQAPGLPPC